MVGGGRQQGWLSTTLGCCTASIAEPVAALSLILSAACRTTAKEAIVDTAAGGCGGKVAVVLCRRSTSDERPPPTYTARCNGCCAGRQEEDRWLNIHRRCELESPSSEHHPAKHINQPSSVVADPPFPAAAFWLRIES